MTNKIIKPQLPKIFNYFVVDFYCFKTVYMV